ncbi:transcription repressor OFP13-like [Vicia villosa]|uniref:transcription repressor OFP13-like n=1 Tax=Vicia villosa TaxID=3911 RepID=UPI00273CD0B7|nr:transcription repressor OFP13-like [Vicia villosa]
MGKKNLKLSSLFKTKQHPWQFLPSCNHHPKTLSFRTGGAIVDDDMFKTVNSVFFDQTDNQSNIETPKSCFTTTSSDSVASFSTESDEYYCYNDGELLETLVRGVKSERSSERLFFEAEDTSSILEKAKANGFPFKESVVLALESDDPYEDFKRSMEEMVESHGVKDWEGLEELLSWYLRVNGKNNHGFIVGAFVDLLISLTGSKDSSKSCSDLTLYSSAVSSFASSPTLYLSEGQNEITEIEDNDNVTDS